MRSFLTAAIVVCGAIVPAAFCQEFEAVSIKPNTSGTRNTDSRSDRGLMTAENLSLRDLIVDAYGVRDYQVEGPEWLGSTRFDLQAKFPDALPNDREKYAAALQSMMQRMLAGRFHLAIHRAEKPASVSARRRTDPSTRLGGGADRELSPRDGACV